MKNSSALVVALSLLSPHMQAGSFEAIAHHITRNTKEHKIAVQLIAAVGCFCALKALLPHAKKLMDVYTIAHGPFFVKKVAHANEPDTQALSFTTTPHNGLQLQLAPTYNTHWTQEKRKQFKQLIMSDPSTLLKAHKEIEKLITKNPATLTPEWFESHYNPLSLLSECDSPSCPLTRSNSPARAEFEHTIVKTVQDNVATFDPCKTLHYTSFACGSLFPDLIVLTQLIEHGFKNINVTLIDAYFEEYIERLKKHGTTVALNFCDATNRQREAWMRHRTYYLTQFLAWFSNNETEISVTIYGSVQNYIKDCLDRPNMKSDIIVGIDYIENSLYPLTDYKQLLFSTLRTNGYAFNLIGHPSQRTITSEIYRKKSDPSAQEIRDIINFDFTENVSYIEAIAHFNTIEEMVAQVVEKADESTVEMASCALA